METTLSDASLEVSLFPLIRLHYFNGDFYLTLHEAMGFLFPLIRLHYFNGDH